MALVLLSDLYGVSARRATSDGFEIAPAPPLDTPLPTDGVEWNAEARDVLDPDRREAAFGGNDVPLPLFAEQIVGYGDEDENESLTDGDSVGAFACHDGELALLLFVPEVLDPAESLFAHVLGIRRGWSAVTLAGEGLPPALPDGEAENLELFASPGCANPE